MKAYPAVEFDTADRDLLYAAVDDFGPTAIEESDSRVRVFFASPSARDAALAALKSTFAAVAIDVPDEDWARRSQADLRPVTVGLITIVPNPESLIPNHHAIVVEPSMAFGTGHHATTRLCLAALQDVGVAGKSVLDVGTGSGLLAIAAARLGASSVVGIDNDPDAIESARKNVEMNAPKSPITLDIADIYLGSDPNFAQNPPNRGQTPHPSSWGQTPFDVVIANLTGAMLVRIAGILDRRTKSGGTLILSGFMQHERDQVRAALSANDISWERAEDEWVALAMKKP